MVYMMASEVAEGEEGVYLFHFWGTLWGELLTAVLSAQFLSTQFVNEYCIYVGQPMTQLPPWQEEAVRYASGRTAVALTDRLALGRFQPLLPEDVALEAALQRLNLPYFRQVYEGTRLVSAGRWQAQLRTLLG